jgi:hypothetical protein
MRKPAPRRAPWVVLTCFLLPGVLEIAAYHYPSLDIALSRWLP